MKAPGKWTRVAMNVTAEAMTNLDSHHHRINAQAELSGVNAEGLGKMHDVEFTTLI